VATLSTALEEIIDRLYGLPLEEFTRARNEAARELRKAGQREAAEKVKALRKPTAVAVAVNRLVRGHRGEVEQFMRAAAALRDAQLSGKGGLAAAAQREREELDGLIRIGGEAVRQTLLAAAADDDAAQQLIEARLERELAPRGFGTLLDHARTVAAEPLAHALSADVEPRAQARSAAAGPLAQARSAAAEPLAQARSAAAEPAGATASQTKASPPERKKPDDSAARARREDAKAALRVAEADERQARRRWEHTQSELEKARAAVEEAQRHLDRLHSR
jgi:hypothetical protein